MELFERTRTAAAAALLLLGAGGAFAQNLPVPEPGEEAQCGVHYYGPCLPEESRPAPAPQAAQAPRDEYSARTAFDEYAFAGDDPLTQAILAAESGSRPEAAAASARTVVDPAYKGKEARPAPVQVASAKTYSVDEGQDLPDGEGEPPPGWRHAPEGTRLDPVETAPAPEEERIVRGIVGRGTGTSQLNFVAIRTPGVAGRRGAEDAASWLQSVWDGTQAQVLTMDLETHAREHNFMRERGAAD